MPIPTLVLLPGLDGTGELFADFVSALDGIKLRCVGFDFEPELTAKFLLRGHGIVEVPVRYNPRRADEGKKVRWTDGVDAVYVLLKCRFGSSSRRRS